MRVRAYKLVQKDQGLGRCSPCTGLDGGVAQGSSASCSGDGAGMELEDGDVAGRSGRLDPTVRLGVDLRSREVCQGGVRFAGGEQLLGSGLTGGDGFGAESGACRASDWEQ